MSFLSRGFVPLILALSLGMATSVTALDGGGPLDGLQSFGAEAAYANAKLGIRLHAINPQSNDRFNALSFGSDGTRIERRLLGTSIWSKLGPSDYSYGNGASRYGEYFDDAVTPGATYEYRGYAVNDNVTKSGRISETITIVAPLTTQPFILSPYRNSNYLNNLTSSQIELGWQFASNPGSTKQVEIYFAADGDATWSVTTAAFGDSSKIITGLKTRTVYAFRIRINLGTAGTPNWTGFSDIVKVVTDYSNPKLAMNPTVTSIGSTVARIIYYEPNLYADANGGYISNVLQIKKSSDPDSAYSGRAFRNPSGGQQMTSMLSMGLVLGSDPEYLAANSYVGCSGLQPATSYTLRFAGVKKTAAGSDNFDRLANGALDLTMVSTVTFTTAAAGLPCQPALTTASATYTPGSSTTADANISWMNLAKNTDGNFWASVLVGSVTTSGLWYDTVVDQTGVKIYRRLGTSGAWTVVGSTTTAKDVAFTDSTLALGSTYQYRLSSYNSAGESLAGPIATVTTPGVTTTPGDPPGASVVGAPTMNPRTGTYATAQTVTLSSTTSGATIYYTLDGSTPSRSSLVYATPLLVSTSTGIRAFAVKTGSEDSSVTFESYTITLPANGPGDLNGDKVVNVSDLTLVTSNFGKTSSSPGFDARADSNGDGVVNVTDMAAVTSNFGKTYL